MCSFGARRAFWAAVVGIGGEGIEEEAGERLLQLRSPQVRLKIGELQPISLLRFSVSEGLTQAESLLREEERLRGIDTGPGGVLGELLLCRGTPSGSTSFGYACVGFMFVLFCRLSVSVVFYRGRRAARQTRARARLARQRRCLHAKATVSDSETYISCF